jgi:hypothetical protein
VSQMGLLRRGADCEGVLVPVAEGDLSLAAAASMLFFVPTLFRLAVGGTPDAVLAGFADVGGLTDMLGLTDAPAAIARLTNVVRARG